MANQYSLTYAQDAKVFIIQGKLKSLFFGLLGLTGFLLAFVFTDFIYHLITNPILRADFWQLLHISQSHLETQNRMMATSFTAKLFLPKVINWLLIILIFVLNRARPKATYHNFAMMTYIFVAMILLNTFVFIFYRTPVFANGFWYTVFAFPFIALPIHEYQKMKKATPHLLPNPSFLKDMFS